MEDRKRYKSQRSDKKKSKKKIKRSNISPSKFKTLQNQHQVHQRIKNEQLIDLRLKVQKSQPILQTIYDKVKGRQAIYIKNIIDYERKDKYGKTIINGYRELYEQGMRIMQKNRILDFYPKRNKYADFTTKQKTIKKSEKSIYEQYRQKIDGITRRDKNIQASTKVQVNKVQQVATQLSQDLKHNINQLQSIRQKSQANYSNCQSRPKIKRQDQQNILKQRFRRIKHNKFIDNN